MADNEIPEMPAGGEENQPELSRSDRLKNALDSLIEDHQQSNEKPGPIMKMAMEALKALRDYLGGDEEAGLGEEASDEQDEQSEKETGLTKVLKELLSELEGDEKPSPGKGKLKAVIKEALEYLTGAQLDMGEEAEANEQKDQSPIEKLIKELLTEMAGQQESMPGLANMAQGLLDRYFPQPSPESTATQTDQAEAEMTQTAEEDAAMTEEASAEAEASSSQEANEDIEMEEAEATEVDEDIEMEEATEDQTPEPQPGTQQAVEEDEVMEVDKEADQEVAMDTKAAARAQRDSTNKQTHFTQGVHTEQAAETGTRAITPTVIGTGPQPSSKPETSKEEQELGRDYEGPSLGAGN